MTIVLIWLLFMTAILSLPLSAMPSWVSLRSAHPKIDTVVVLLSLARLVFLFLVLRCYAASDVRDDMGEVIFYTVLGLFWVFTSDFVSRFLGISMALDAIERRNPAALWAATGSTAAVTFCYAGANIGEGPGVHVVMFCALLSTAALFFLWLILELATGARLCESIGVERNVAAGVRLGGYLAALGIILGASVAGDWTSLWGTLADFAEYGWPAAVVVAAAVVFERAKRSVLVSMQASILLAGSSITCAAIYVAIRGLR